MNNFSEMKLKRAILDRKLSYLFGLLPMSCPREGTGKQVWGAAPFAQRKWLEAPDWCALTLPPFVGLQRRTS